MANHHIDSSPGHAFISYVREDADDVDRLQMILEAAGIRVWRDTGNLWPGQDWKIEIRKAITAGSIAFIACFSRNSQQKRPSYQYEELTLAVDEIRRRPPGMPWLIPVRFSECEPPEFDLGAGRTLNSLQRVDLFGGSWEVGAARLTATIVKILGTSLDVGVLDSRSAVTANHFRSVLLKADKQIEVEDIISQTSSSIRATLQDEKKFPVISDRLVNDAKAVRFLAGQVDAYAETVETIVELLIPGCTWGQAQHEAIWTRVMREVASADKRIAGHPLLVNMTRLPALIAMYAASLAAINRGNFGAMRAVTVDPLYREQRGSTPLVNAVHPWVIFENNEVTANVLALRFDDREVTDADIEQLITRRFPRRHTPISDYLYAELRPAFSELIVDDDEYDDAFDRLEAFLGLIATDVKLASPDRYMRGTWCGRFTWRYVYSKTPIEKVLHEEILSAGAAWPPLLVGLFGGSAERAGAAAENLAETAASVRQHQG